MYIWLYIYGSMYIWSHKHSQPELGLREIPVTSNLGIFKARAYLLVLPNSF